jgi:hypothetical protein
MSNEIAMKNRATVSLRVSTKGKLGRVMRSLRRLGENLSLMSIIDICNNIWI